METLYYCSWPSPVGVLTLAASPAGLVALMFGKKQFGKKDFGEKESGEKPTRFSSRRVHWEESEEKTRPYRQELEEYFLGERTAFSLPLDLRGTEFQKRCWQALLEIPYGQTRSYAEIARAVGNPQAFRAVGMANNRNPIPIVVPCHRVIAADGSLCGYGGGLDIKEKLLRLERAWAGFPVGGIA